jgi:hypothetical protein
MSETFLARPADGPADGDRLCVVRLLDSLRGTGRIVELFVESSKALLGHAHPNVVSIVDFDVNDGWPYVVTEHHGGILCSELAKLSHESGLELSGAEAVYIVHRVLAALSALHGITDGAGRNLGFIHGDVGLERVFVCPDGQIKLDCMFAGNQQLHNLRAATINAKEQSCRFSPEQVLGLSFDHRADIFNAAVMLVELLIRRPLFIERSQLSTLLSIRDVKLDTLEANRQRLPPKMDGVVLRALSREPAARYAAADEMAGLLTPFFGALTAEELQVELSELVSAIMGTDASTGTPSAEPGAASANGGLGPGSSAKPVLQVVTPSSPPPKPVTDVHTRPTPVPDRATKQAASVSDRPTLVVDRAADRSAKVAARSTPVSPSDVPTPMFSSDVSTPMFPSDVPSSISPSEVPTPLAVPTEDFDFDFGPIDAPEETPVARAVERERAEPAAARPAPRVIYSPAGRGAAPDRRTPEPTERSATARQKRTTMPGLGEAGAGGAKRTSGVGQPSVIEVVAERVAAVQATSRPSSPVPREALGTGAARSAEPDRASGAVSGARWAELEVGDDSSFWADASAAPAGGVGDEASTLTMPIGVVTFRRSGRIEGPLDLQAALEKVRSGAYALDDEASVNDGPFMPIRDVRELGQAAGVRRGSTAPGGFDGPARPVAAFAGGSGASARSGSLDDVPTSRVLFGLKLAGETGLVVFEHGPIRKDVYVTDGDPVYVSSNIASESLAEFLVRKDALSRMELEMALAMKWRFNDNLGEALDGLGIMSGHVFEGLSREHLRNVLLELLGWSKGEYRVYSGQRSPEPGVRTGVSTYSLLLDASSSRISQGDAETWVREHASSTVERLASTDDMLCKLKLPEISQRVLRSLDTQAPTSLSRLIEDNCVETAQDRYFVALTIMLARDLALIRITPRSA